MTQMTREKAVEIALKHSPCGSTPDEWVVDAIIDAYEWSRYHWEEGDL